MVCTCEVILLTNLLGVEIGQFSHYLGIDPSVDSHSNSGWKPVMALVVAKVVVMMGKMVQWLNQRQ